MKVVTRGRQRLAAGQTIVEVAAHSGFMGVFYVLMWAPLACCLVAGRRRYGKMLRRADHVLHRLTAMPTYRKSREKYRRQSLYLLAALVGSMLYVAAVSFYESIGECAAMLPVCSTSLLLSSALLLVSVGAFLVPFKFALIGLELLSGFRAIAQELRDVCQGKRRLSADTFHKLRAIYLELSDTFSSLTGAMFTELITVMAYGTLASITILLLLICDIRNGAVAVAYSVPVVVLYLLGATLAVALPCEIVQRVLDMVSQTRGLLLKPQAAAVAAGAGSVLEGGRSRPGHPG